MIQNMFPVLRALNSGSLIYQMKHISHIFLLQLVCGLSIRSEALHSEGHRRRRQRYIAMLGDPSSYSVDLNIYR